MRLLPVLPFLLAAACSDAATTVDAGVDASAADATAPADATAADATAADARPDAQARDIGPFDGNELRDATTGDAGLLTGTPIDGLTVDWDEPVELCVRWREGSPIHDEVAAKAVVTIYPAPRPSLSHADLSAATLDRVFVRRGPFSDLQWDTPAIASNVVDYRLFQQPNGAASLGVEIEHDLGRAGVLIEGFGVYRAPGDTRPVDLTADGHEHGFSLRSAALEDWPASLERCAGHPTLDDAVHVLTASRNGEDLSIVRYARTADAVAGSAPVHLRGLEVRFSDDTLLPVRTYDPWAMTYAAEHHNWNDTSHFDLRWDLAAWSLVFGPWMRTGQAPVPEALETIDLRAIDTFGPTPEVDLTWRDFGTGAARTETWTAGPRWIRVDSLALGRTLTCQGGQVVTLFDFGDRTFQLLTCPRAQAPGFALEAVVPVYFREEPASAGQSFDGATEVTVGGRAGYRTVIGGHRVVISKDAADPYYFLSIEDASGAVISESLAQPGDLWPQPREEALNFENGTGDISLSITRRWIAWGVGESSIYAPTLVQVAAVGRTWHVEAWDRLEYENTHHNWNDSLIVHAEDATLEWRHVFLEQRNTLRITAADGTVLLPETELESR